MERSTDTLPSGYLLIDFKEPETVIFERVGALDSEHWFDLINWWGNGGFVDPQSSTFITTLDNYLSKRSWFKDNWRLRGREVRVSKKLKTIVDSSISQKKQFLDFASNLNPLPLSEINLGNIKRELTAEQKHNIASALSIPNGANFSVPGAGKTTTTLAIWSHLKETNFLQKMLVICPKSAFEAWLEDEPIVTFHTCPQTQQLDDKIIKPDTEILVTNFEKLENIHFLSKLEIWMRANNVLLVIDEAHRIKGGGKSVRWIACNQIARFAKRVELLTGTPMPQGYSDLKNLFQLSWRKLPAGFLSDDRISRLKNGGVFVRTTKDQLKLPEVHFEEIPIVPSTIQAQVYSALKRSYNGNFKLSQESEQILAKKGGAVMTLLAASTNPGLLAGKSVESAYLGFSWPPKEILADADIMEAIQNYVSLELPPKYEWVLKFIKKSSQEGKKTIIWSSLVGNLLSLHKVLKHFNPSLVYGGVDADIRKNVIEKFRNDKECFVLLTNPQTLGEGISFHKVCNQAIYIDRTYNAGQYLQSLDRIHRLGLPQNVVTNIYILTTDNSIDNRIAKRLRDKIFRMAEVLNDNSLRVVGDVSFDYAEGEVDLGITHLDISDLMEHLSDD
ncbi:MAG: SNF2-related protein [Parvibaculales bacterium]